MLCPWDFPGKNTRVGGHVLLQGIFLTQGWNPHLLHGQAGSLPLSHQERPNKESLFQKFYCNRGNATSFGSTASQCQTEKKKNTFLVHKGVRGLERTFKKQWGNLGGKSRRQHWTQTGASRRSGVWEEKKSLIPVWSGQGRQWVIDSCEHLLSWIL